MGERRIHVMDLRCRGSVAGLDDRSFAATLLYVVPGPKPADRRLVELLEELESHHVTIGTLAPWNGRWWVRDVDAWLTALSAHGVTPGLLLAAAEDSRGLPELPPRTARVVGSRETVEAILAAQLERHVTGCPPAIDDDPAWVVRLCDGQVEAVHEALTTSADGHVGTRGQRETVSDDAPSPVLVSGVYDHRQEIPMLLPGPCWTRLVTPDQAHRSDEIFRSLDLRTGVVLHEYPDARSVRFASLARPGILALRFDGPADRFSAGPALSPPCGVPATIVYEAPDHSAVQVHGGPGGITAAAVQQVRRLAGRRRVERLVAMRGDPQRAPAVRVVQAALADASEAGFERLLAEQRAAWAARWTAAEVSIPGDPDTELAVRFGLFHLMNSVASTREAAVGARGLSGPAYAGHVFWDADVFVLPFLAATHPPAARAMLEYRCGRLEAARQEAIARGVDGIRFPWESADSGEDVTPSSFRSPEGDVVPIRTGQHEEHVVADVAWAAAHYASWSGDDTFLAGPGTELIVGAAKYIASSLRTDAKGGHHLYGVIGPDEYHEIVDDNAYTNVMARWTLRTAAALLPEHGDRATGGDERRSWSALADALVDGYDAATGIYEQFAGYRRLEPLLAQEIAPVPFAADLVLGRERVARTQIIKQADVLMLHHLVPGEVAAHSLRANLDHYLPRTSHGSSLSPAIHAALLARVGRPEQALDLLRIAARIDLDDLSENASGGLHLAAYGGMWQALAYGFLGTRPARDALEIDPAPLPATWEALELRLSFRGVPVRLVLTHRDLTLSTPGPLPVRIAGRDLFECGPGPYRCSSPNDGWRPRP